LREIGAHLRAWTPSSIAQDVAPAIATWTRARCPYNRATVQQQRRRIQQLSPALVNRIAAGEVIERPASVVKELVENAIDAGATNITVEIEEGGRELIRVTDDGHGIPPDELPLAFAEHATSKLATDDDLFRIATMGFRGEALASIGSVSHARVLSRTRDDDAGCEIHNRGGAISDPQAAAGNVGTVVEVRNLFFNVPARRKFLKGTATESGHVSDVLLRLALPHPQIAFKLISGGRTTLELPAAAAAEERLLSAWPDNFREQRLPIESRDAEVRLSGVVGLPELASPTAKHQYLYLNGRHIRDKSLNHALREAYRGLTEPGRHPAAILLLSMPPQDVDVNVHPTKIEVRFRDSSRIYGLILSSLREKLLGSDLTPRATVSVPSNIDLGERQDLRTRLAEFFKQAQPQPQQRLEPHWHHNSSPSTPALSPSPSTPGESRGEGSVSTSSDRSFAASSPPSFSSPHPPTPPLPDRAPPTPALQLHNSYLVTESDDGLVIIDQHALHERIMYEELLTRLSRGPLESQRLLIPDTLPASTRQLALLDQIRPLLTSLGIDVAPFGPGTLAVQSFPTFLEKLQPAQFVQELLERGEQELLDLHQEELLHEILDMMACKAAIKAGDPLTPPEIEALLAKRHLIDRSSNCPHGRPTTLRLSLRDLEKQFKRTGF
jgi:DNA mismatch repair protein MutL